MDYCRQAGSVPLILQFLNLLRLFLEIDTRSQNQARFSNKSAVEENDIESEIFLHSSVS